MPLSHTATSLPCSLVALHSVAVLLMHAATLLRCCCVALFQWNLVTVRHRNTKTSLQCNYVSACRRNDATERHSHNVTLQQCNIQLKGSLGGPTWLSSGTNQ
jgi:hypothetical protein